MSAELWKIKEDNLCLANAIKKKGSPSNKSKKAGKKTKTKKSKTKSNQRPNDKNYTRKKVAPKDSEAQTKIVSNLKYWWCPYHNAWTCHNPDGKETEAWHKRQDLQYQQQVGDNIGTHMASALVAILTDIQEEEQEYKWLLHTLFESAQKIAQFVLAFCAFSLFLTDPESIINPIIASILLGASFFQVWLLLNTLGENQTSAAHTMR